MEQLEGLMKKGMAGIVADEFADSTLALKQLNAAAVAPIDTPNRFVKLILFTFYFLQIYAYDFTSGVKKKGLRTSFFFCLDYTLNRYVRLLTIGIFFDCQLRCNTN